MQERINNQIKAKEVRIISGENENLGVFSIRDALEMANSQSLDLIEITPGASPPVVKMMNFGKYAYEKNKRLKKAKAGAKSIETKSIQIRIGTNDHDLELKAKMASKWLKDGHRVRVQLYLMGRSKYMDQNFLKERLNRVLHFITENYKLVEAYKKSPKGLTSVLEKA